jgi:serralysin
MRIWIDHSAVPGNFTGTVDFNGDGKSDILWQNDDGTPAIWTMDGTNIISSVDLPNPGNDWHLV